LKDAIPVHTVCIALISLTTRLAGRVQRTHQYNAVNWRIPVRPITTKTKINWLNYKV